jgi:cytochrome d ubiquinol oxidase subunit I
MTDILAARTQMAMSLAFHIAFAVVGMGMPLLMVISEGLYLKTKDKLYLTLTKRWAKGTAIMFAVGAVSGTVLSFELGLLWPKFMEHAGPVIGMPFSLEGFAFFLEAIFLGIYLYGWDRVSPKWHWFSGIMVFISGTMSGVFVVAANAWMNTPTGFKYVNGKFTQIDPWAAMFNPAAFSQCLHMTLAAFVTIGFSVAAIHAYMLLRQPANLFHRHALKLSLWVGGVTLVLQLISGDISAKHVGKYQPAKLAAMEGQWHTEKGAPLRIGGIVDEKNEVTKWAIELPYVLSFLAFNDFKAEVRGLKSFPKRDRPPVAIVHYAFQIMVGAGMWMLLVAMIGGWLAWRRKKLPLDRWYLWMLVSAGPMGLIAIEAGWTVTEVGRQPWIIYNIMRTADAVTPMPGLIVPLLGFTLLYIFLAIVVITLLRNQVFQSPDILVPAEESVDTDSADQTTEKDA